MDTITLEDIYDDEQPSLEDALDAQFRQMAVNGAYMMVDVWEERRSVELIVEDGNDVIEVDVMQAIVQKASDTVAQFGGQLQFLGVRSVGREGSIALVCRY